MAGLFSKVLQFLPTGKGKGKQEAEERIGESTEVVCEETLLEIWSLGQEIINENK